MAARMAGWVMASSRRRAASSPKTRLPRALRSSRPSWPTTPGKAAAMAASAGVPGSTTWRASRSASMTGQPSARSAAAKVDLPVAMPPVSPTRRTLPGRRLGVVVGGRLLGRRLLRRGAPLGLGGRLPGPLGGGPGGEGDGLHRPLLVEEDRDPGGRVLPDLLEGVGEGLLGRLPVGALDGLGV